MLRFEVDMYYRHRMIRRGTVAIAGPKTMPIEAFIWFLSKHRITNLGGG